MSLFASRRNTLTEQRMIGRELEALLGAAEVTGLNAWERARLVYGTELAGEERPDGRDRWSRPPVASPAPGSSPTTAPASPASPVQTPLFEEAA